MSVSTNLYLNQRWGLDDIKVIVERTQEVEVVVRSHHSIGLGYFTMEFGNRQMHVHSQCNTPIGSAILLSMGADEESHRIFRDIAGVLGGILMKHDYDSNCEMIDGAMNEDNALPYFLKYAIIHDGIDPENIEQLAVSREAWRHKHKWHRRLDKA